MTSDLVSGLGDGTPWLGVLIPVYNGADTLAEALSSIIGQQDGVHVVLVDQGSSDASRAIAEGFQDRLNLTIIDAPENKNWVQNTNLALSRTTAPFVCLLHQDDTWTPGRSDLVREAITAHPDAALWVHGADYMDQDGRCIGGLSPPLGRETGVFTPQETLSWLLVQNTIPLPAPVFRRNHAESVGGLNEELWYTADWDFWLSLAKLGPLVWRPDRKVRFRLHRNSLTMSGSRNLDDFADQLARPVAQHLDGVAQDQRAQVEALAHASNELNVWLASRFHDDPKPLGAVLRRLVQLGPLGVLRLARRTQIWARLYPRLRLMRGKS